MERFLNEASMDRYDGFAAAPPLFLNRPQKSCRRSTRHPQAGPPLPADDREEAADELGPEQVRSRLPQPPYTPQGPHHVSSYSRLSHDHPAMHLSARPPVEGSPGYPSHPITPSCHACHGSPAGSAYLTGRYASAQYSYKPRRGSDRTSVSRDAASDDVRGQRLRSDTDWEMVDHESLLSHAGLSGDDTGTDCHHIRADSGVEFLPRQPLYKKAAPPAYGLQELDLLVGVGSQFW